MQNFEVTSEQERLEQNAIFEKWLTRQDESEDLELDGGVCGVVVDSSQEGDWREYVPLYRLDLFEEENELLIASLDKSSEYWLEIQNYFGVSLFPCEFKSFFDNTIFLWGEDVHSLSINSNFFKEVEWKDLPQAVMFDDEYSSQYTWFFYPSRVGKESKTVKANTAFYYYPTETKPGLQYLLIAKKDCPGLHPEDWFHYAVPNPTQKMLDLIQAGESRKTISDFLKLLPEAEDPNGLIEYFKWKIKDNITYDLELKMQVIVHYKLWLELNGIALVPRENLLPFHLRRHFKGESESFPIHPLFYEDRWHGKEGDFVKWVRQNQSSFADISTPTGYEKVCKVHGVDITLGQIKKILREYK